MNTRWLHWYNLREVEEEKRSQELSKIIADMERMVDVAISEIGRLMYNTFQKNPGVMNSQAIKRLQAGLAQLLDQANKLSDNPGTVPEHVIDACSELFDKLLVCEDDSSKLRSSLRDLPRASGPDSLKRASDVLQHIGDQLKTHLRQALQNLSGVQLTRGLSPSERSPYGGYSTMPQRESPQRELPDPGLPTFRDLHTKLKAYKQQYGQLFDTFTVTKGAGPGKTHLLDMPFNAAVDALGKADKVKVTFHIKKIPRKMFKPSGEKRTEFGQVSMVVDLNDPSSYGKLLDKMEEYVGDVSTRQSSAAMVQSPFAHQRAVQDAPKDVRAKHIN